MNFKDNYTSLVKTYKRRVVFSIKYTVFAMSIVMLMLAVALLVDLIGVTKVISIEAGDELPLAEEISKKEGAVYDFDGQKIDTDEVGEYRFFITYGKSGKMKVKLKIADTEPPKGKVNALFVHNGVTLPEPEDFFDEISDASDFTASFTKAPSPSGLGEYEVSIALEDEHGNRRVFDTKLSVITDTERPSIVVENEIVGYIGEGIAYKNSVRVTDNCFGVKLEVDSSDVDMEKEGTYVAVFTATDAAGNKTEAIVPVHIRGVRVTEEMLNELIADVVKDWKKTTDKKELCKMIYEYVNDPTASASSANFTYVGHSNDESREDFRREAYLTLKNGQGDCYSYFSLSKALFEYFGLENKDIERTKGLTKDTHFWNMVNIGSEANPRWYFFDATRFAGKFTLGGNNGCLMTAAQLESYKPSSSGYGNNYYAFDSESYPKTETSIINEGFTWN